MSDRYRVDQNQLHDTAGRGVLEKHTISWQMPFIKRPITRYIVLANGSIGKVVNHQMRSVKVVKTLLKKRFFFDDMLLLRLPNSSVSYYFLNIRGY
jgi:hypothetical protein